MQIAEAVRVFLIFKESAGLTEKTLSWYRGTLSQFCDWLGLRDMTEITSLDIAQYLVYRRKKNLSSITIEGNYRGLMAFFNWCEGSTIIGKPPSPIGHGPNREVDRPKTDEPDFDYTSYEEFKALVDAIDLGDWIDYRDWCMLHIMFWCGVRRGELLSMNMTDLNVSEKKIQIRKTKARDQRAAYLSSDMLSGVLKYLEIRPEWKGEELWLGRDRRRQMNTSGRLMPTGLRSMLIRRCKRAESPYRNAHLFRHGFGMEMLMANTDIKAVSQLMGHSDVRVTERNYVKHLDRSLRRIHQQGIQRIAEGYADELDAAA